MPLEKHEQTHPSSGIPKDVGHGCVVGVGFPQPSIRWPQWTHRVRLFDALFPDMAIMPPTPAADTKPDTPAASAEPSAEPSFFPTYESASEPSAELRFQTRSVSYPFHTRFIPRFIPQALVPTPWPSQLPARANDYVSASCHSDRRERVGEPALHCGLA